MTLDEAIIHCEEVADRCDVTDGNIKCANEHRQLAEWLKDYKRLIEQEPFPRGQKCGKDGRVDMTEAERIICKIYLEDLDKNGTCNEYKLLMRMLEQDSTTDLSTDSSTAGDCISREDALMALTGEWTELTDEVIARFIRRIRNLPSAIPKKEG